MKLLLTVITVGLLTLGGLAQSVRKVEILGSPLGNASSGEVAVIHSTGLVYTGGQGFGANYGVIDPLTNTLIKVLRPADLNNQNAVFYSRANQTTKLAYFLRGAGVLGGQIDVIDGRTASPTFNQLLPTLTFTNQIIASFAVDQTRNRIYVTTRVNGVTPVQSNLLTVDADPASPTFHQVLTTTALPAGQQAGCVVVNQTTNKVYVGSQLSGGGVFVFNAATQVLTKITSTVQTAAIVVNETSNAIYAGINGVSQIQAIDGVNDTFIQNISVGGSFAGTFGEFGAVNSVTERVYAILSNGTLGVIDGKRTSPSFNAVIGVVPNIGVGSEVAVSEQLNKVVVTATNRFDTLIIDEATGNISVVKGNIGSADVAINPLTNRAFVGYTFYTTQNINLNNNTAVNIGTIHEMGEGFVNPTNNSFYFGNTSAVAGAAFLNQSDTLGAVGDLIHGFGRYVFSTQNKTTNRLYFVNSSSNISGTLASQTNGFLEVANGTTNNVVSEIEVGGQPFSNPAVNELTNKLYQMNAGSGTGFPSKITVINGANNSSADVNTSAFPANTQFLREPSVNPTTNRIYFRYGEGTTNSVGVISGATDVATPLAGFTGVFDIKVNPTLNRIYFLTATGVRVLDGANDTEIANVALTSATNLTINQTTGKIYVRNSTAQTLSVIDPTTNTVITTAALPANLSYNTMTINEATNEIYLGAQTDFNQENTSSVLFVNGNTLAVRKTLPVPLRPSRIYVNAATQTAYVTPINASQRSGVVVISTRSTSTPFDFDGDGKADLSVFRPSSSVWYLQQSTAGFTGVQFGSTGDLITPADFDGDGKTDVAVFRPSTGTWYLQRSSLGFTGIQFGANGDVPMPADFDGDGKADLAVFRPSSGTWYLQQSTAGLTAVQFGANGDAPVAADYDGDGKADVSVFRQSTGIWYLNRSQLGFTGIQFGTNGDKPVPADYDADGKADLAVFRPSTGTWYLQRSQLGFTGAQFGATGDLPVAADYDGDGKADLAVFRSTGGIWYLQQSQNGFTGIQFGASGDKPAPNAFVP